MKRSEVEVPRLKTGGANIVIAISIINNVMGRTGKCGDIPVWEIRSLLKDALVEMNKENAK